MNEYKGRILLLAAHPDDEIIFLWPFLHLAHTMIACADDLTHPKRQWCIKRKDAFAEIGKKFGIPTRVLRYDSGFARLDQGTGALRRFVEDVRANIHDADMIAVHNSWGEYGHLDHVLLHQICRQTGKTIFTTDICINADWYPPKPYHQGEIIATACNDPSEYEDNLSIYRKHNAMGWTHKMIESANIIRIQ